MARVDDLSEKGEMPSPAWQYHEPDHPGADFDALAAAAAGTAQWTSLLECCAMQKRRPGSAAWLTLSSCMADFLPIGIR
jgi:hypothetical protein